MENKTYSLKNSGYNSHHIIITTLNEILFNLISSVRLVYATI